VSQTVRWEEARAGNRLSGAGTRTNLSQLF